MSGQECSQLDSGEGGTYCALHLETVIQSEVSQKEENQYGVISLICGI